MPPASPLSLLQHLTIQQKVIHTHYQDAIVVVVSMVAVTIDDNLAECIGHTE